MKLTIALLSIGAFCLSTVEAITSNHKLQSNPLCKEKDFDCWMFLSDKCDLQDDECIALALGAKQEDLPDCQAGDDNCWEDFWNDFWYRKPGSQSNHVRRIVNQHMKVSNQNHKAVYY